MSKTKTLKKEIKQIKKEIKQKKNVQMNKELLEVLENELNAKLHLKEKGHKTSVFDKITDKFEEYSPQIKYLDNIKYRGNKVLRIRFDEDKFDNKQKYTVKKVQKISNKLSEYLNDKGVSGLILTSMLYGKLGWRSGYFDDIGDDVKLYEPTDSGLEVAQPDNIKSFVSYVIIKPKNEGGDDINNDCLYIVLNKLIYNFDKYFKSPEDLKKYLGLKRNDKVPIDCIFKIEQKLKTYQINVRGDYIYSSTVKSLKVINLTLIDEHYDIDRTFNKKSLCKYLSYTEKHPVMYDKKTFEIYDGQTKTKISKEEKQKLMDYKSPFILVLREKRKISEQITIEEEYKDFVESANILKKETKGMINLFKSGSYNNAALDLFDRLTKCIVEPDEILQDEGYWIKEASTSALIWAEEYEGELYKYDIKSAYPYLMTLNTSKFPIKRGEFEKLEKFEEINRFGIYRCKIYQSEDPNINKLFKFNKTNFYPSISLDHAKRLGLEMELIQDNQPNFLFYSSDKLITFEAVFKPFVDMMFDLKNRNIPKAKDILNRLWGALCEVDKRKYYDNITVDISDDEEIFQLRPCHFDEEVDQVITNKINKRYLTNYARLCPFLLGKGRQYLSNMMQPYKEHIHRIQTDGFFIDKEIHQNRTAKLGELKFEGYTKWGVIKNCTNPIEVI